MSLTQALNTSMTGLKVTQQGLSLVASNVANAETPGYVRKTHTQASTVVSGSSVGVRTSAIGREIDLYVQKQLRTERAGGSYADVRAEFYSRLQSLFGDPGSSAALENIFNTFTESLQALAASPDLYSTRTNVLSAAQTLAQQLNGMSNSIQFLRADAEQGLSDATIAANDALQRIAEINSQLTSSSGNDLQSAILLDQRDRYLDQLSELMDIRVLDAGNNQVTVFTSNGLQLVGGGGAGRLSFEPQGSMTAAAHWDADPALRNVGTLTLHNIGGGKTDLLANGAIRSGKIAALVEMRDQVLVEAQAQLDGLAAAMSQALSDTSVSGTPVTTGGQTGFDIDVSGMLAGNTVRVQYFDAVTQTNRTVSFMRVNDASALPLPDVATADPNDRVVGIDFSAGMPTIISQIAQALGPNFNVSNPAGSELRILGAASGSANLTDVTATKTETGLEGGDTALAFFVDGANPYAGAFTGAGSQLTGLASRIAVNGALLADPSKLVMMSGQTAVGDPTRPNFIYQRLTGQTLTFAPQSGIGSTTKPFESTLGGYLRQVLSQQGQAAAAASNLQQGQEVVLNALKQRVTDASGVNVDQEMATLLNLQNAYGANARVMSAVKELFDLLMRL